MQGNKLLNTAKRQPMNHSMTQNVGQRAMNAYEQTTASPLRRQCVPTAKGMDAPPTSSDGTPLNLEPHAHV